jgi:hypothetical protein
MLTWEMVLRKYDLQSTQLPNLAENYILEQTYDMTYFKLHYHFRKEDDDLEEIIQRIKHVDIAQMGLHWSFGFQLVSAIEVTLISSN